MNADSIHGWLRLLVEFGTDLPDLLSVLLGTFGAWCFGLLAEAYFIPASWPARQQKGVTIVLTLAASVILSDLIWAGLDPADPVTVRLSASFIGGCIAPFLYPLVGRLLPSIPFIGPALASAVQSAWALPK